MKVKYSDLKNKISKAFEADLRKAFKEVDKKKDQLQYLKQIKNVKRCLLKMKMSQKIKLWLS